MKKIVSIALTVILVVAMSCVGIPVSATNNDKATIYVYDFYGAALNDKNQSTHPELAGKGVQRDTYTFEVGDVVNIEISYYSEVQEFAASAVGEIYVNQTSIDPTSEDAFKPYTDGIVDTVKFSDIYYTSENREEPRADGEYYSIIGNGSMCNPVKALEKNEEGWNSENDAYKDRCSYLVLCADENGYSIATPNKIVKGITMVVTEASESYLYTALNGVINPDITDSVHSLEEEIIVTTTLNKVGHIDIELVTEPATEPVTESPTLAPTEASTQAPTEPATEPVTETKTEPVTELETEIVIDYANNTYTVVGTPNLCDINWDPTHLNNDMIDLGNGVYQKVYTNVPAGDIEFKVAENYSWENSFGTKGNALDSPNCMDTVLYDDAIVAIDLEITTGVVSWTIDYPGISTEPATEQITKPVTVPVEEPVTESATKPATEAITELATKPATESVTAIEKESVTEPEINTYTVAGTANLCGSNWDAVDITNDMIDIGNGLFQKVYTGVNAGDIEFKVAENYSWENSFGPEGNALGSINCSDEVIHDNATVTISFDTATGLVTWDITYPDFPTEPTTELLIESITQLATEPVTELITEPVTELITELATELVTEHITELTTELATKPATDVATDEPVKPTSAKNPTDDTTATQSPTKATAKSTQAIQTTAGKVATGDASSVTILIVVLMIVSGAVVIVRKRIVS